MSSFRKTGGETSDEAVFGLISRMWLAAVGEAGASDALSE
jgi:hypothetical protein